MKLEDLLKDKKSTLEKKLQKYYETATPEQVVSEMEALGMKLEKKESFSDIPITNLPPPSDSRIAFETSNVRTKRSTLESQAAYKKAWEEADISDEEIKENQELAELGISEWEENIRKEENSIFNSENFQGSNLQKSMIEIENEIVSDLSKQIGDDIDKMITNLEPDYPLKNLMEDYDPPIRDGDVGITIDDLPGRKEENIEIPDYLLNDPEIVGYPNQEMMDDIYDWVNLKIEHPCLIKDLGAGRGDFYGFLENKFSMTPNFIGIELNPNLCQVGKKKYPGIQLINDNFFDVNLESDYSVCIGTLNENHGQNKWEYFNKTLNYCFSNTKKAIIFVLSSNMQGFNGFLDYPIDEMVQNLGRDVIYEIDYSKFKDIYLLTVHIGSYN